MLHTPRLILRRWQPADRAPFAQMNADPEVMRYFPACLSQAASDALVEQIEQHHQHHGYGLWAVEVRSIAPFIGFIGLKIPQFEAPFMPTVEVGWRLAAAFWGQGYATEGAQAVLRYGFEVLQLPEIVSFTAQCNTRSIAVMQRLGMTHDPADNFDHPLLPAGHPLQRHVLYRMSGERHKDER